MAALTEIKSMTMAKLDSVLSAPAPVTRDLIDEWVHRIAGLYDEPVEDDDLASIVRELEAEYNVHVGQWTSLADDEDHVAWLPDLKAGSPEWPFWSRYERYLRTVQGLPPASVRSIDDVTDDVLARIESPSRPGKWDRRGLVAGQVQSGKTGSYLGLIAKSIDCGYKLIVVLAGVHNSLRSQTQARLDEGILGFDTRNYLRFDLAEQDHRIGVGRLGRPLRVNSFTSSKEKGDFSLAVARNLGVQVGGSDPIVLVVKKNKQILNNLFKWATALNGRLDEESGRHVVPSVPLLVIDDEADHASVDTNGPRRGQVSGETDPTVINGLIRQFLETFEQSAYVGYTATPFANIFISPRAFHKDVGKDLFPSSFIVNLPAPSTYVGPSRVFGLQPDPLSPVEIESVDPLPITRSVDDHSPWLPDTHRSDHQLPDLIPDSLREAVTAFLVAGAVRRLRGQGAKHHSMLVHVTRFTMVQRQVAQQIRDLLDDLRDRLTFGEGANPAFEREAEELYRLDHAPTWRKIQEIGEVADLAGPLPAFADVWREMAEVAASTRVHIVNGTSDDALEYVDHPGGLSVIAIGGDKLSRGLTLEGLSVSYYLRASRMYDTLMQMGRWFGYRPGYLDLCRLYTTDDLRRWYVSITAASEELMSEFDAMAALGRTPTDFGLRVRSHPDGLLVTSPAKLRHATKVQISYSAARTETVTFDLSGAESNWSALGELLGTIGAPHSETESLKMWTGVQPQVVLDFLNRYRPDERAIQAQPQPLRQYIQSRVADSELVSWTIALGDVTDGFPKKTGGVAFGLTRRTPMQNDGRRVVFRRIVSPRHELATIQDNREEWDRLLERSIDAWRASTRRGKSETPPSHPSPLLERQSRDPREGLLLLYGIDYNARGQQGPPADPPLVGFACSFPASQRAVPIDYQVNKIFWEQEYAPYGVDEDTDA